MPMAMMPDTLYIAANICSNRKNSLSARMKLINVFGRIVDRITSEHGQTHYYDYMQGCMSECLPLKSYCDKMIGLQSPRGQQMLPNYFADVFTQFDAVNNLPDFVPVSNGEGWALVSLSMLPVLMTDFQFRTIIPERWERRIFFVQDKETLKWGAISTMWHIVSPNKTNCHRMATLETLMPCIADEIYEDQLMVEDPEELPSLFFMTRIGNKVGILTDCGYSPIIYDTYETDSKNCSFRLIRNDRRRARRANWWQPDGKDLFDNIKRRNYTNAKDKKTSTGQI